MSITKPILVTGSHRSGTTWVGRMLAHAPSHAYIHEPFSVTDPPSRGVCNTRFPFWYTYVTGENSTHYYAPIKRTLALKYSLLAGLRSAGSTKEIRRVLTEFQQFRSFRCNHMAALLKDPIAFFSAEWLSKQFDANIVVLIRHPAAFVSSIKKLGWGHPFGDFVAQPLLMERVLHPFDAEIRAFAAQEQPLLEQAILLWKIIHATVASYQQKHPDWIFVRHEDLSRDPLLGFRGLYQQLGLVWTPTTEAMIQQFSSERNPSDPDAPVGSERTLQRDSRQNIKNWQHRLTPQEIARIRSEVEGIANKFYSDADWD